MRVNKASPSRLERSQRRKSPNRLHVPPALKGLVEPSTTRPGLGKAVRFPDLHPAWCGPDWTDGQTHCGNTCPEKKLPGGGGDDVSRRWKLQGDGLGRSGANTTYRTCHFAGRWYRPRNISCILPDRRDAIPFLLPPQAGDKSAERTVRKRRVEISLPVEKKGLQARRDRIACRLLSVV